MAKILNALRRIGSVLVAVLAVIGAGFVVGAVVFAGIVKRRGGSLIGRVSGEAGRVQQDIGQSKRDNIETIARLDDALDRLRRAAGR